jgi:hypothetical protein
MLLGCVTAYTTTRVTKQRVKNVLSLRQFLNLSTVGIPPIDEPNSEASQRVYLQKRTRIFPALFGYALPYLTIRA